MYLSIHKDSILKLLQSKHFMANHRIITLNVVLEILGTRAVKNFPFKIVFSLIVGTHVDYVTFQSVTK